jgi:hypothetical protein
MVASPADAEETLLVADLAHPLAGGASTRSRSFGGSGSSTSFTGLLAGDLDLGFQTKGGILETNLEIVAQISAALCCRPPTASSSEEISKPKEVSQDILETREYRGIKTNRTADSTMPKPVILGPLLGIAENTIGFSRLLEAFFSFLVTRILIGMVFYGQFTVAAFDVLVRGRAG